VNSNDEQIITDLLGDDHSENVWGEDLKPIRPSQHQIVDDVINTNDLLTEKNNLVSQINAKLMDSFDDYKNIVPDHQVLDSIQH